MYSSDSLNSPDRSNSADSPDAPNVNPLISPLRAVRLAFAATETMPPDAITEADLAAAEARWIVPAIGAALRNRLAGGDRADFVEGYLAAPLALFARTVAQPRWDIRSSPAGTASPRTGAFAPATAEAVCRLRRTLLAQARTLLRRATDYLDAHPGEFPEYDPAKNILKKCNLHGNFIQTP